MKKKTLSADGGEAAVQSRRSGRTSVWILGVLSSSILLVFTVLVLAAKLKAERYLPFLLLVTAMAGGLLFCVFQTGCTLWNSLDKWEKRLLLGIFLCLCAGIQAVIAMSLYGTIDYDFNYLYQAAAELAKGKGLQSFRDYFAQFPNNTFLMLCFELLFRVCRALGTEDYLSVLTVLNILVIDLTILLAVLCAKKMFGRKTAALSLLLLIPVLGFHRGVVLPYSDSFCMLFPVAFLYLYVTLPDRGFRRWRSVALMAACLVIGVKIKPQAAILPLAVILYECFAVRINKETWLRYAKTAGCFLLTAVVLFGAVKGYTGWRLRADISKELEEERAIPMTHYLMMGMNKESGGFINAEDYNATIAHPGSAAKIRFNLEEIGRRLGDFGITGYGRFLWKKHTGIFGGAKMDMWIREPFAADGPLSEAMRRLMHYNEGALLIYETGVQGGWLLLFGFMLLPVLLNRKKNSDRHVIVLRLTLCGLWLFLLLFEAGPRYLFHQLPVFCILAAWGMGNVGFSAWWERQKAPDSMWRKLGRSSSRKAG